MQRREFVTALGGVTAMWPFTARAQQSERMRRIGVLMSTSADDPEGQARIAAFSSALHQLGWTEGRNAEIHSRWPKAGEEARKYAADLVALAPDVIVATGVYVGPLLQQATQTVPIVFVLVADPVGAGFVASLARRGGEPLTAIRSVAESMLSSSSGKRSLFTIAVMSSAMSSPISTSRSAASNANCPIVCGLSGNSCVRSMPLY